MVGSLLGTSCSESLNSPTWKGNNSTTISSGVSLSVSRGGSISVSANDWTEIVAEIGPKPGDLVITKRQWGAFYGTELDLEFRRRGITTIVLCGISTNIGVESTARFAYELGYNQIFAEDAMSALSAEEHMLTVTKIFPRIGLVRKTGDILADLSHD